VSKILSQAEVDALLQGMSEGEVAAEPEAAPLGPSTDVRLYDFRSTERVARLGMPTFEVVNDRFANFFQDTLGNFIRRKAEFSKVGSELLRFEDFLRSLIVPTSLNVFRPSPLRGMALIVLGSHFVFNVVEIFFGGKGGSDFKIEGREFTAIEQRLIGKLVQVGLRDLAKAWEGIHPLQPQMVRSEINPQFARVVPPGENVVVTTFRADLHNAAGQMQICIPLSVLEPIRPILSAGFQSGQGNETDRTWQRRLIRVLQDVPVEVVVELGRTQIKGRDLLSLTPGQVIGLGRHISTPVTAVVAGVPKLEGFIGQLRGSVAFQVAGPGAAASGGKECLKT
jgi:flagellar motor switch protein FliM